MKKLYRFGNAVFDEHALGVARHQCRRSDLLVVGEQDGRLLVAEVDDRHLPQRVGVALELDAFVEHLGRAEQARQRRQRDALPGGGGPAVNVALHLARAATQRDEVDVARVELGELSVGGQL